ncbi:MAG TPA: FAD-dependent oxidoreductase [Oculatellaceae cyanobacterium]
MAKSATKTVVKDSTKSSVTSDAPWPSTVSEKIKKELILPQLDQNAHLEDLYDIAIIGAGIAGLSTARAAAARGAKVVVLERAPRLAAGASGKNAGILGAGVNTPLVNMPKDSPAMALWQSTSELVMQLYSLAAQDKNALIARNVGALSLAKSETAVKRLVRECKARNSVGLRAEIVAPAKVADLTFDLLDLRGVQCALFLPDEGRINPWTLLAYSAREARKYGCTLFGGADITERAVCDVGSGKSKSQAWRLSTANGLEIKALSLVYATGPVVNANRRIYAISYQIDLPEMFPLFWDSNPFTYYDYRGGEGFLTVTGGKYGNAGQTSADERFHEGMIAAARSWMPALRKLSPTNKWAVDLEVASDMMPESVEVSKNPPAFSIQGLGALGVLPGMVLGKETGEKIVGLCSV